MPAPTLTPQIGEGKRGAGGHIAYLLRQAAAALRSALDAEFAAAGLTGPQFLVLNLLAAYPGISGAELARLTQLTPQTINLVVRKLERDALVDREPHASHGRVLCLAPTAKGRRTLQRCKRLADGVERRMSRGLGADAEALVRRWLVDVALELATDAQRRALRGSRRPAT
jgi:DNA-binding MarR family transcriptional regulator